MLNQDNKITIPTKLLSFSVESPQRCDDLDFLSTLQLINGLQINTKQNNATPAESSLTSGCG